MTSNPQILRKSQKKFRDCPEIQTENEGMKIGYARVSTDDQNPDLYL